MKMDRYISQMVLKDIFPAGQKKINESSVVIVGAGGTGSVISELLVRSGVGIITIMDDDEVELSNLNRQSLYNESDIGKKKAIVAKEHLAKINSEVEVIAVTERLTRDNVIKYFTGKNLIMDGTDNYGARGVINESSVKLGIPWIFTAVEGHYGYVKAIIPFKTSCLACIGYPLNGESIPCTQTGVLPSSVHVVASIASTLALKVLLDKEVDGDLVFLDAWNPLIQKINLPRNNACRVCGVHL